MAGARDPTTGLTPQMEAFAQGLAAGKSQADAYRAAYPLSVRWKPETLYPKASNLAADDKILARVQALRAPVLAKAEESVRYEYATAMEECATALKLALAKENPGAAVSAIRLRAELRGLLIERKEVGAAGAFALLSDAEIDAEIARIEASGLIARSQGKKAVESGKPKSSGAEKRGLVSAKRT